MDKWDAVAKELAPILGEQQCQIYITRLKKLSKEVIINELSNLLDLSNENHLKLIQYIDKEFYKNIPNKPDIEDKFKQKKNKNVKKLNNSMEFNKSDGCVEWLKVDRIENMRQPCTCLAQRHSLINNCLNCGRIVCEQEGSGPCFTCGDIVCTSDEKAILLKNNTKSVSLMQKLTLQDRSFQKAIRYKKKLIEQDRQYRNIVNHVIDDQNDYFTSKNKWLSQKDREFLKEQELKDETIQIENETPKNTLVVDMDLNGELFIPKNTNPFDTISCFNSYKNDIENKVESIIENKPSVLINNNNFSSQPSIIEQKTNDILQRQFFINPIEEIDNILKVIKTNQPPPPITTNYQSTISNNSIESLCDEFHPSLAVDHSTKFLLPELFRVQDTIDENDGP